MFALMPLLAMCVLGVAGQLYFNKSTYATDLGSVVYDSLPSVNSQTNYPSLGYQATSTSEFGDYIHLGGTNRILDTVTVTLSDWAKYSDYSSNEMYSGDRVTWAMPITLNVYSNKLGANGSPDTKLATKTQTFNIPWRPESDSTCGLTSNGKGWKIDDICYNYSGIASNITFDLSSLNVTLPDDVIIGVAYNTKTYGFAPSGIAGPYESLNVAIPDDQLVSVGRDDDADAVYWDTTYLGYSSGLRTDRDWAPNGTVSFRVTATAPIPPTVTITSPTLNQPINGRTVTIKGTATDTDFNYYYCYVSNVNGHEYGTRDASCNTTWHAVETASVLGTVSLPNDLADGNYVAHLIAYDKAGNSKETTQPFMLDNTAPIQPIFTAPVNNLFTKTNFVVMTWANGNDSGLNQSGIKGYTIRYTFILMYGGSAVEWTSGIIANGNSKTHSGTYGHGQGTYTMYVSTVDNAGNVSPESNPLVLSYDATAPVATITAPAVNAVSGHALSIEGTAIDANFNYYYCYVTDASGEVGIRDPQCITSWSAGSPFHSAFATDVTGTLSGHLGSVDLTGLSDGVYQVHLFAYDKAGNSTESAPVSFTLDNTPPVINLIGDDEITVVSGNIYVDQGVTAQDLLDSDITGSVVTVNKVDTSKIGDYTITYDARDSAGNNAVTVKRLVRVVAAEVVNEPARTPLLLTQNAIPITPIRTTGFFGQTAAADDGGEVLGDATTEASEDTSDKGEVKGDSDTKQDDKPWYEADFMGVAWYGWVVIAAAAIGLGWWAFGVIRRRDS